MREPVYEAGSQRTFGCDDVPLRVRRQGRRSVSKDDVQMILTATSMGMVAWMAAEGKGGVKP